MERAERKKLFDGIAAKDFSELKARRDDVRKQREKREAEREEEQRKAEEELWNERPTYTRENLVGDILPALENIFVAGVKEYSLLVYPKYPFQDYNRHAFGYNGGNIWGLVISWFTTVVKSSFYDLKPKATCYLLDFFDDINDMWLAHYPNMKPLFERDIPQNFTLEEK